MYCPSCGKMARIKGAGNAIGVRIATAMVVTIGCLLLAALGTLATCNIMRGPTSGERMIQQLALAGTPIIWIFSMLAIFRR